jgi:hypothetical protein
MEYIQLAVVLNILKQRPGGKITYPRDGATAKITILFTAETSLVSTIDEHPTNTE